MTSRLLGLGSGKSLGFLIKFNPLFIENVINRIILYFVAEGESGLYETKLCRTGYFSC